MQYILIFKSDDYPTSPDFLGIGEILNEDNLTEEQEFERLEEMAKVAVPSGNPYKFIRRNQFYDTWMVHRELRNCLVYNDGDPCYDLQLIKDFKNCNLRVERMKPLDDLDAQYMKALETGSSTESIVSEKQRLRYITDFVESLTTMEDILAVTVDTVYDWTQFTNN